MLAAAQLAFGIMQPVFGPAALGTLFGVAFLFHQVGSFVSAWIGGLTVSATGGYTPIWCIDAALCLLAASCAFQVREGETAGPAL